jgi:putative thioredoxin
MKSSEYIVSVSEVDFEYQVIAYSQKIPVVVDFWAEWCVPCKMLGPLLERLTEAAQGAYRLAKVNVDENPNLALRFNVRSIPAVKAFRNGQVVAEFIGAQPEPKVKEFMLALAPSKADLMLEKAQSYLQVQKIANAENTFRQVLAEVPNQPAAILGLIKCLIQQGRLSEANKLLKEFPPSREYVAAEALHPLTDALNRVQTNTSLNDDPLDAAYTNALRLVMRGNLPAALDGLLDILHQDKHYHNGEAHRVILALFEVLGENNPLTRQYRSELASVLF